MADDLDISIDYSDSESDSDDEVDNVNVQNDAPRAHVSLVPYWPHRIWGRVAVVGVIWGGALLFCHCHQGNTNPEIAKSILTCSAWLTVGGMVLVG